VVASHEPPTSILFRLAGQGSAKPRCRTRDEDERASRPPAAGIVTPVLNGVTGPRTTKIVPKQARSRGFGITAPDSRRLNHQQSTQTGLEQRLGLTRRACVHDHVKLRLAQPTITTQPRQHGQSRQKLGVRLQGFLSRTDSTPTDWTKIGPILALTGKEIHNHGQVRWYLQESATTLWKHTPPALVQTTALPTPGHYQTRLL
jgi:hypothetical protein